MMAVADLSPSLGSAIYEIFPRMSVQIQTFVT